MHDLIIIGGGPAGMMAGVEASSKGASVLILEKKQKPGIKLLITGKGRCNITNYELDKRQFIGHFGSQGNFLFSGLSRFGVTETIDFFEGSGLSLKTERGNRVFPISDRAHDVLTVLERKLKENKVEIYPNININKIILTPDKKQIDKVVSTDGEEFVAKKYLIAVGGKSYPATGSDGNLWDALNQIGHTMIPAKPSLVPIICQSDFIKELEGLSLKNVDISIWQAGRKVDSRFGEALFTGQGMSGPIILDMSQSIGNLLTTNQDVFLRIDFKPAIDFLELDQRLQKEFQEKQNKIFKNSLHRLLPKSLLLVIIDQSGIDPGKKVGSLSREERKKLVSLLKSFEIKITGLEGFDRAIITSGGVSLNEVDPKTCQSKIIDNLWLAGEILDLDGPTGGFNLQVCWTTGYLAGVSSV